VVISLTVWIISSMRRISTTISFLTFSKFYSTICTWILVSKSTRRNSAHRWNNPNSKADYHLDLTPIGLWTKTAYNKNRLMWIWSINCIFILKEIELKTCQSVPITTDVSSNPDQGEVCIHCTLCDKVSDLQQVCGFLHQ
jgi:hypothetical protein